MMRPMKGSMPCVEVGSDGFTFGAGFPGTAAGWISAFFLLAARALAAARNCWAASMLDKLH